jgi:tetratricopeptide (TPR) repeat protein
MLHTVMDGYKQVAGQSSNAPEVATLLTSAALTYSGKGNHRRAEELLTAIVKIDEGAGAWSAFTLSNSLGRLASWYMDQGRTQDARRIEDRMKEILPSSDQPRQWAGVYDSVGFIPK